MVCPFSLNSRITSFLILRACGASLMSPTKAPQAIFPQTTCDAVKVISYLHKQTAIVQSNQTKMT